MRRLFRSLILLELVSLVAQEFNMKRAGDLIPRKFVQGGMSGRLTANPEMIYEGTASGGIK